MKCDSPTTFLICGDCVLQSGLVIRFEVPVDDKERVDSRLEFEMGITNSLMVQRATHVATRNNKFVCAWEYLSFEEESVDKCGIFGTLLFEAWVLTFECEIDALFRWDLNRDEELFDNLVDCEKLGIFEFSIESDGRRSKIWFVYEFVEWHKEYTIIRKLVADSV